MTIQAKSRFQRGKLKKRYHAYHVNSTGVSCSFCFTLAAQSAANNTVGDARDDVEMVATEDPEMNAAVAEANRTLPQFITRLLNPREYDQAFAIKFPLAGQD